MCVFCSGGHVRRQAFHHLLGQEDHMLKVQPRVDKNQALGPGAVDLCMMSSAMHSGVTGHLLIGPVFGHAPNEQGATRSCSVSRKCRSRLIK